jgi:hypothetical protein
MATRQHLARHASRVRGIGIAIAACALATGCEQQDGAGSGSEADIELSAPLAKVVEAWRGADLAVLDLHALDGEAEAEAPELGGSCIAATVDEIPVVVCEHASADDAEAAKERGLELVGGATGLALARGELLLVAADRHEVDPDGRRLNELANAFRQLD